ncbi:hypothetical protein NC995_23665 [Leptolyngbya sp. FACHB-1515]
MLHRDRFRWMMLPLLTGAMLATGHPAQADIVIYNGSLSIGMESIDRDSFYSPYRHRRPTQIFTNRIEDSTLINPVVIGVPIEDSTLINPVIVPPSRGGTVVIDRGSRRTTMTPQLGAPYNGNPACTAFVHLRPACW